MATALYFHATIFRFTPEGVDVLISRFYEQIDDVAVHCRYLFDKDLFEISCPSNHGTQSYDTFARLCSIYVQEDDDGFVKCTPMNETRIEDDEAEMQFHEESEECLLPLLVDAAIDDGHDDENVILWSPNAHTNLSHVFSVTALEAISVDTGVAATLDHERRIVVLRKTAVSFTQKAISKLGVLQRDARRTQHIKHTVRTDNAAATQLKVALFQLKELPEAMLRTLLPCDLDADLLPVPGPLTDGVPIMCLLRFAFRPRQGPPLQEASCQPASQAWDTLPLPVVNYAHKPGSNPDPMAVPELAAGSLIDSGNESGKSTPVLKKPRHFDGPPATLSQLPTQPLRQIMSNAPGSRLEAALNEWMDKVVPCTLPTTDPERQNHFDMPFLRMPDLQENAPTEVPPESYSGSDNFRTSPISQENMSRISGSTYGAIPLRYNQTVFNQYDWEHKPVKADVTGNMIDASELGFFRDANSFPPLPLRYFDPPLPPTSNAGTGPPETGDLISFDSDDVQPVPLQDISNSYTKPSASSEKTTLADDASEPITREPPPLPRASSPPIEETKRIESDSPKFYNTMRQQKGKKSKFNPKARPFKAVLELPDPVPVRALPSCRVNNPAFTASLPALKNPAYKILPVLEQARSFRGDIRIEIQLGQILFHNFKTPDARSFAKTEYNLENFEIGLRRQVDDHNFDVLFNRRLTTSLSELYEARVGFYEQAEMSSACYEFDITLAGRRLCVRVTDTGTRVESIPAMIGCVYFHYPSRTFDARCVVQGFETATQDVKGFSDTIRTGQVKGHTANVTWVNTVKGLTVDSVYAIRSVRHRNRECADLSLEFTEKTHLLIHENNNNYVAYSDSNMTAKQRKWFQAAMVVKQNPLLSQNTNLQVGDDADWQPIEILTDDMLQSVVLITDCLLSRVVGVGTTNRGPRGGPNDMEMIKRTDHERWQDREGINKPYW